MATAPLGSGTRRVAATMARMAARISASVTVRMPSTKAWMWAKLRTPTLWVRRPSAIGTADKLGGPGNDCAGAKAFRRVAGQLRLYAEDLCLGTKLLDGRGHAAQQAAAGDGRENQVHIGEGFDDLQAAGGLAGDDLLVVIRRHDDVAVLTNELFRHGQALAGGDAYIDDLRAQRQSGSALDGRSVRGHHDDCFTPHGRRPVRGDPGFRSDFARHVGHGLRMVAARVGDDAAANLFRRQLQNFVGRAAHLECADGLEALRLKPDSLLGSVAGEAGKCGFDQRGFYGDGSDAGGGGANFGEGDERGGHGFIIG